MLEGLAEKFSPMHKLKRKKNWGIHKGDSLGGVFLREFIGGNLARRIQQGKFSGHHETEAYSKATIVVFLENSCL